MNTFIHFDWRMPVLAAFPALALLQAQAGMLANIACMADTTLQVDFPDNNTGGADSFTAGGRNTGGPTRALLRFDVASSLPPGATINSASLEVTVSAVNGPDSTFALHRVLAAWGEGEGDDFRGTSTGGEGEATWNVRLGPGSPWATAGGDYAPSASATQGISAAASYSFASAALVADVQTWMDNPGTNFGWILLSESESTQGTIRRFLGRIDTENPPRLVVEYSLPVPATVPPLITNIANVGGQVQFSFLAESNRTYAVEFRNSLTTGDWTTLTNLPSQPVSTIFHITNSSSLAEQYFRIRNP